MYNCYEEIEYSLYSTTEWEGCINISQSKKVFHEKVILNKLNYLMHNGINNFKIIFYYISLRINFRYILT